MSPEPSLKKTFPQATVQGKTIGYRRRLIVKSGLGLLATAIIGCRKESTDGGAAVGGQTPASGVPSAEAASPIINGLRSNFAKLGPLGAENADGLRLPPGFSARIVARTGVAPVRGGKHIWHEQPDGGATYETQEGGWIYVSNAEVSNTGGVSALVFDKDGKVVSSYAILTGTSRNCAGGKTPWGTWLSCEEIPAGRVFECDPYGIEAAVALPALGRFNHEAVCVDPKTGNLFLTEDAPDGRLYRFVPRNVVDGRSLLGAGKLEVASVSKGGGVTWTGITDPSGSVTPTRKQVPESTPFDGGEGIWFFDGIIYFATKGDNKIWKYEVEREQMSLLYDAATHPTPTLTGVDNVTVSCCGDVLVAEDGGDLELVCVLPDGSLKSVVQIPSHTSSEITGPAFDPSGTRLYFSSQRGSNGAGITYEISGPFHEPA